MNFTSRLVSAAAIAALLPAANALAADYDPPIIMEDAVVDYAPEVPVEIGTGWYLRGDIGYSFIQSEGTYSFRTYDPATSLYGGPYDYTTAGMKKPFSAGIGFGYRFTDYLRADATFDVFKSRFDGTSNIAEPCFNTLPGTGCRTEDTGDFLGVTMLANAYVDLGTYVGFTPYIGAGVGATYVRWGDVTRQNYCTGIACPGGFVDETTHEGSRDLRFTWAAMAGVAYDVSPNMKIDLGYRYRHISGGSMYEFDAFDRANGATGDQGTDGGWTNHEVRVGLRYELW
ncbi:MAG TPA: outer membrane protein [Rhizobiaceae bacterium]|nr:outer membrane protein [Rhizobiaceae bacterium]